MFVPQTEKQFPLIELVCKCFVLKLLGVLENISAAVFEALKVSGRSGGDL